MTAALTAPTREPWRAAIAEADRYAYQQLGTTATFALCHVCRYADWSAAGDMLCTHPVDRFRPTGAAWDVWAGGDCYLFRPMLELRTPDEAIAHLARRVDDGDWPEPREDGDT